MKLTEKQRHVMNAAWEEWMSLTHASRETSHEAIFLAGLRMGRAEGVEAMIDAGFISEAYADDARTFIRRALPEEPT